MNRSTDYRRGLSVKLSRHAAASAASAAMNGMHPANRPSSHAQTEASAIAYLAGDEASFVHGAVLDVDGGRNAA